MLDIMAGVDQKDSYAVFAGDDAPRAVLLLVLFRPWMLDIMAGMDQKDSYAVFAGDDALALFRRDSTGAVLGQFLGPLCATTGALVQGQFLDKCLHARCCA